MTNSKQFQVPILFLVFNRPDTTAIVFEELRKLRPARLYVAADGARPGRQDEIEKCKETRDVATKVDWPCEVKTLFREENLGCGKAVSGAISWFFDEVEEGIILEDDCLPSPTFFQFCEELLMKYRDDDRVMHIGGNNFLGDRQVNGRSYYFSRYGHIWGWATWRRAWKMYDFEMKRYESVKEMGLFDRYFFNRLERIYRLEKFDSIINKKRDTWDYQWDFARFVNSGLSVIPKVNLVKNIGYREDATHTTKRDKRIERMQSHEMTFPLTHPPFLMRDIRTDHAYVNTFLRNVIASKFSL